MVLPVLSELKLNLDVGRHRPVRATDAMTQSCRSRITPQLTDEVVRRYQSGETSKQVAESCGLGKSTVLKLLRTRGAEVRPIDVKY